MVDNVRWEYVQVVGPMTKLSPGVAERMEKAGFAVDRGVLSQNRADIVDVLNYLGDKGWELATTHADNSGATYTLKRPRLHARVQDTIEDW